MRHFEYIDPRLNSAPERSHEKNLGVALMLEFFLGICQIFGVGHIYAGNWKVGVSIMTSYLFACMANAILVPFAIGIISWPITWLIFFAVTTEQVVSYAKSNPERFA